MPGNWNIWISAGVMRSIDCSSSLQLQVTFQRSLLPDERYVRGPDEIQRQLNWGCVVERVCIPNQTFVLPSLDSTRITDNKVQQLHNKLPIFAKVIVKDSGIFLTRCESSIRFLEIAISFQYVSLATLDVVWLWHQRNVPKHNCNFSKNELIIYTWLRIRCHISFTITVANIGRF